MSDDQEKAPRPMGKNTLAVTTKKIKTYEELEAKRLEAELEAKRLEADLERERLRLESKKIEGEGQDKARDDRRALVNTILRGVAVVIALVVISGVTIVAFHYGQKFSFSGFGFNLKAGDEAPAEQQEEPKE
jgi:hypothetical protein